MYKPIRTEKLIRVLNDLGFENIRTSGSHAIFKQLAEGVIVTVPMARRELPAIYLNAIAKQLIGAGLVSKAVFEKLIGGAV